MTISAILEKLNAKSKNQNKKKRESTSGRLFSEIVEYLGGQIPKKTTVQLRYQSPRKQQRDIKSLIGLPKG
jgi:hypothetical protein